VVLPDLRARLAGHTGRAAAILVSGFWFCRRKRNRPDRSKPVPHLGIAAGTDRAPGNGYFAAKLAQETLIKDSGIPYTIVRATQFFEFTGAIAQTAMVGTAVRVSSAMMQPIAAADVAAAVTEAALAAPRNGIVEVAGPEPIRMDELVRQFLAAHHDGREIVTDDAAGYFGAPVDDHSLTPGANPKLGRTHFADWLRQSISTK